MKREEVERIVQKLLSDLEDGAFDRLEEMIEEFEDALEKIPKEFVDLRKRVDKEIAWAGEELRKIYMDDD